MKIMTEANLFLSSKEDLLFGEMCSTVPHNSIQFNHFYLCLKKLNVTKECYMCDAGCLLPSTETFIILIIQCVTKFNH